MATPKFPITIKVGHTIVKIYHSINRMRDSYSVVHYLGNKRIRKNFTNLDLATTSAQAIANQISNGEVRVLELKNEDQFAYARAMQSLAPTGVPIDIAASHFAEAFAILGADRLVEAARFFKKHHPTNTPAPKVPKVFKELLESKEQDGLADVYLKDLRGRLGRFAEAFKDRDINLVTAADIEDFLRCLKVKKGKLEVPASARSRNNYRRLIATLLYFAESRGYPIIWTDVLEPYGTAASADKPLAVFGALSFWWMWATGSITWTSTTQRPRGRIRRRCYGMPPTDSPSPDSCATAARKRSGRSTSRCSSTAYP